jgi:hypothetical protein
MTIRVTAGQKRIAAELLASRGVDDKDFIDRLLMEVVTANDERTRYVVVVEEPRSGEAPAHLKVFGDFATTTAAMKAVNTGLLASRPGARGAVLPLIKTPRKGQDWT